MANPAHLCPAIVWKHPSVTASDGPWAVAVLCGEAARQHACVGWCQWQLNGLVDGHATELQLW